MDTPWYAVPILLVGLALLWLALRGRRLHSREDTEVGLLASLPEPVWRGVMAVMGLVLTGLAVAVLVG